MAALIQTEDLNFSYEGGEGYPDVKVLEGITLNISAGEFVAVLGHNGSGKSTLAKHFNAILLPSGGKVYIDGIDTALEERIYDIRQRVGMVFQNPDNQIVATVVEEDVAFALENLGVPPAEIRERVDEALKSVGMYDYRERAPYQLSGGQKQRVAIAGIIAMRPRCIVLDEPTAMLDPSGRREVLKTIRRLNRDFGITIVLITHYMDEAARADRVVVMDAGLVVLDGTPREVFMHIGQLKEIGLDVPQVTELSAMLKENGMNLPDGILFEDECVEAIARELDALK
ncbi:energy-coupling factor transporter ATPase [Acetanaerobacterium elongatum]|uniref:ABC transporter ATP-binding protein n=1 Tax=Acetanaerobacterium elongatum TaxID=258515 RepID=A0A1G9V8E6_9FIRM|nr:energy-coupling factor transporter ATPase [Acetanaerobacterium elongatum]SDM68498.1 energy-coupling factor transport system ATP-binding protein [Acetanaerobacterium elongatum]